MTLQRGRHGVRGALVRHERRAPRAVEREAPARRHGRVWWISWISLATSYGAIQLKTRGFKMGWMTGRAMSLVDIARHVIGCHSTQETRVHSALNDVAGKLWQALIARHVIGCHLTQESRVQSKLDDVAGNIWHALQATCSRHVLGSRLTQETRVQSALDDVAGNMCQALRHGARPAADEAALGDPAAPRAGVRRRGESGGQHAERLPRPPGRGVIEINVSTEVGSIINRNLDVNKSSQVRWPPRTMFAHMYMQLS